MDKVLVVARDGNEAILAPSRPAEIFRVDPVNGDNTKYGGETWSRPLATIQKAHDLAPATGGVLILLANFGVIAADFIENLIFTKPNIYVKPAIPVAVSRYPTIKPASGIALDLRAGAWGCSFGPIRTEGKGAVGTKLAADGCKFREPDFTSDTTHGLLIAGSNGDYEATGSGLWIRGGMARECGGSGIRQGAGVDLAYATNVRIQGMEFYGNTGPDLDDPGSGTTEKYWYQWRLSRSHHMDRNKAVYLGMNNGIALQSMIEDCDFNDAGLNNVKIKLSAAGMGWVRNYDSTGLVPQSVVT